MSQPLPFIWNGEAFEPANRHWGRVCDERFVVGQTYTLDEQHARSSATHAHYFATVNDIWQILPEVMAEQYPNAEILRKHALIRTGYCTMKQHVCVTKAEAERLEAAVKPYDPYQIVTRRDNIVTVYTATSQDYRSMDKRTFAESKEKVLDWCHALIGADSQDHGRAA